MFYYACPFGLMINCIEILTGEGPFYGYRDAYILRAVSSGKKPERPRVFEEDGLWTLLLRCWSLRADDRPTMTEILDYLS
jgi:hypothetical protein